MEAEIATITIRYKDKIDNLKSVLKTARRLEEAAIPPVEKPPTQASSKGSIKQ